jgi:hypothetical protein
MDSGDVDAALVSRLSEDPTLKSLLPDGVFFDEAPQGAQRFALLKVTDHTDDDGLDGVKAFEHFLYLVKAVIYSTSGSDAKKAAKQIDALIHGGPRLTPANYLVVRQRRASYVRYAEPDVNPDARWQHRGGEYLIDVAPLPQTAAGIH